MNILSTGTGIFSVFAPATSSLFNFFIFTTYGASLLLCTTILYPLAAEAYALFWLMAGINYSVLGKELQHIITNIQIFSGIFMLFIIAFNLLQFLVNPDSGKEKNLKALITKVVVVLVLLVSSSFIFNLLDDLQHAIIGVGSDHLIEKIITGNEGFTKEGAIYEDSLKEGKYISYSIFFSMYNNKNAQYAKEKYTSGEIPLITVMLDYVDATIGLGLGTAVLGPLATLGTVISQFLSGQTVGTLVTDIVDYTFPIFTDTVGVFLIIMFVKFAVDIGVRNLTLLFLRMIFPIMAISYLLPSKKDNYFIKYVTYYLTVYVSYFLKVAIIYVLFFIITWMLEQLLGTSTTGLFAGLGIENHGLVKALLLITLLVAIFMFYTKGVPAIAKKVFGVEINGGGMFSKAAGLLAGAVGFAVGGAMGAIKGAKSGGFGAALKGLAAGGGKAASLGNNVGKSVGAGKIVDAFKQGTSGFKATKAGINDAINSSKKVKAKNDAISKANEADNKYRSLEQEAKLAEANASMYGKDDNSVAAKQARMKADNARNAANAAKVEADAAAEKARSYDKSYKSTSESSAERKSVGSAAAVTRVNTASSNYEQAYANYENAVATGGDVAAAEQQLAIAKTELNSAVAEAQTYDSKFESPVISRADSAVNSFVSSTSHTSAEVQQLKQTVSMAQRANPNYVVAPQTAADTALVNYENSYAAYEQAKTQFVNAGSNPQASAAAAVVLMGAVANLEAARSEAKEKVEARVSLNDVVGEYDAYGEQRARVSFDKAQHEFNNYTGTDKNEQLRLQKELMSSKEQYEQAKSKKAKYNPDERLYADELGLDELAQLQDKDSLAKKLREKLGVEVQEDDSSDEDDEKRSGPFE